MSTKEIEIDSLAEAREALQQIFDSFRAAFPQQCDGGKALSNAMLQVSLDMPATLAETIIGSLGLAMASIDAIGSIQ